ncbi:MAG TPA: hypothetical protein VI072_27695 [Polyangiaceae bacterium]
MSVRLSCTLLVSLCAGCAGSAAHTPPASSPVSTSSSVLVAKAYRAEREPGVLSMCQDGRASPELRLAWSTRANGTRKIHGAERARDTRAERARASECVALRAPSVERE